MSGETITLNPDGPHSPEYTKEVAYALSEAVRVLNHATQSRAGLEYPSDVAAVVGALHSTVARLEQTCTQLVRWLSNEYEAGRVAEWSEGRHGGNAFAAMNDAKRELDQAIAAAGVLASHFNEAHQITSALEARAAAT
jgi:hypothetical protein